MSRTIIALLICGVSATAFAQRLPAQPDVAHAEGWCAGFAEAAKASMRNRDHLRQLMGDSLPPFENHNEAIKRIYANSSPWCDGAPDKTVCMMMDSIDLYVVVPGPEVAPLTVELPGGKMFPCPKDAAPELSEPAP